MPSTPNSNIFKQFMMFLSVQIFAKRLKKGRLHGKLAFLVLAMHDKLAFLDLASLPVSQMGWTAR